MKPIGLQNSVPPTRKNQLCFLDGVYNPHFATQLFIQKLGKKSQRTALQPVGYFYLRGSSAQVICPTIRGCFQKEKLRTSLEKLFYHGNCNLLVMLPQIYTLGNNLRFKDSLSTRSPQNYKQVRWHFSNYYWISKARPSFIVILRMISVIRSSIVM